MTLPCGVILKLERRDRDSTPLFKSRTTMYDTSIPENASDKAVVVDEANGFRIVLASESVLFFSGGRFTYCIYLFINCHNFLDHKEFNWRRIELVNFRNVAQASPDWDDTSNPSSIDHLLDSTHFYDWIIEVIDFACNVRRDQRVRYFIFYASKTIYIFTLHCIANTSWPYGSGGTHSGCTSHS